MEILKRIAFGCLVLCFALQFGGCAEESDKPTNNNVAVKESNADLTEAKRKELGETISVIDREIIETRGKQISTAKTILGLTQDKKIGEADLEKVTNLCQNAGKKDSADCKTFLNFKKDWEDKTESLAKTQRELNQLPKAALSTPIPTPTPSKSNMLGEVDLSNLLFWLVGGVVGLAILAGLIWLAYSMISKSFKKERDITEEDFKVVDKNIRQLNQKVTELEKTIKLQSGQFTQIQTTIQSLERRISEISGQKYQPQPIINQPVQKPEPQFPVMAEDYLSKVSHSAQTATADVIGGLLVQDADKIHEFLIVKDNELPDGLFYAVPNQGRFNTKGEYLNYYQNYYALDNPSSGAILIKSPTTVRRVDGGWRLENMGELEIR